MPFLLMVFLVLVCVPDAKTWPTPPWTDSPLRCVAITWLAVALTAAHAFLGSRRVRRPLHVEPALREQLLRRYERGRLHHQIGLFVMYILALLVFGWGWSVAKLWQWPGAELLILAPFVIAQLLAWAVYYDAERESHLATQRLIAESNANPWLELERPGRRAAPMFGSRAAYVFFQMRQRLALVFLPVFLLLIQKELLRLFPEAGQDWQGVINGTGIVALLLVFAAMPWIVRLVLGLKPLPASPLRTRLETVSKRLRFRCSNILVCNTRNGMGNAMVIGIVPWVRYVVFTDRLLEDFTPEEIEAVFGHEIGHIRHHHMLYYLGFLTASVIVLGWLGYFFRDSWKPLFDVDHHQYLADIPLIVVLLGYIFVV